MSRLKRGVVQLLTLPGVAIPLRPLMRERASVFMLHRFAGPGGRAGGHDVAAVRRTLAGLRARRIELVHLDELLRRLLGEGPPPNGCVAFTIDDGYVDHARIAGPLFAEFDCPVTVFVASGFLDRRIWFWWDRIEYVVRHAARAAVSVTLGDAALRYERLDAAAQEDFTQRCKLVPDAEKHAGIARLAEAAGVALPAQAPDEYAPMSWDELRACERRGMRFGPHTVTHPVLSRTSDAQSREELATSWSRLRAEAADPMPVFCYPNGGPDDYGPREIETLRALGLLGAVVGSFGYADARTARRDPHGPFEIRRFADAESLPNVLQYVSGVEQVKLRLRGAAP